MRLIAHAVPLSVCTSCDAALALHPRAEPARRVVGVVRARRDLAVRGPPTAATPRCRTSSRRPDRDRPPRCSTTRYGSPSPPKISSSIARMRSCSSFDCVGLAEREHLDLVELVHAEDAARVLAVRSGFTPEAGGVPGVAQREAIGGEHFAAVQRRQRDLARAERGTARPCRRRTPGCGRSGRTRPLPSCVRARAPA